MKTAYIVSAAVVVALVALTTNAQIAPIAGVAAPVIPPVFPPMFGGMPFPFPFPFFGPFGFPFLGGLGFGGLGFGRFGGLGLGLGLGGIRRFGKRDVNGTILFLIYFKLITKKKRCLIKQLLI